MMGGVFGRLKIERTWGVSLKRKGKQWISEYLLNSPIRNCYVLYYLLWKDVKYLRGTTENPLRQVQKFQQLKKWNFLLVQQGEK